MKHKKEAQNSSRETQLAVVIETPRGSRNKLKYDSARTMFKLSKVMPVGMVFPYDFGYVPRLKQKMEILWTFWFSPTSRFSRVVPWTAGSSARSKWSSSRKAKHSAMTG
jgi:Inorganic pyrophosphatase